MAILHRCDNPPCCNPNHLFLGSNLENIADMVAKGRHRAPQGVNNGAAKLTEEQVREARKIHRKRHPEFGCAALARRYGVSLTAMWEAVNGDSWAHIQ